MLNDGQKVIYDHVTNMLDTHVPGAVFVNASAGTGKSFLLNTIIARERSRGNIVLASAASGCAALILRNARTVHSTFKVPLNIHSDSMCSISSSGVTLVALFF